LLKAKKDMDKYLEVLDEGLEGRQYLQGEYSLVDTQVATLVGWFTMMGVVIGGFKNIKPWRERCMSRPVLTKLFS
jgi:glutathione S-transferase